MNTCRVLECRYKTTHITSGHYCGNCNKFGHGRLECNNDILIKRLQDISIKDELGENKHCDIKSCNNSWSHSRSSHHCVGCGKRGGCDECDEFLDTDHSYIIKCPICREYNVFDIIRKVYVDSKCVVCMENNANVLFQNCSHICICNECCDVMNEYDKDLIEYKIEDSFFPEDDEGSKETALRLMGDESGKIYIGIMGSFGCSFWYRRNYKNGLLEKLFMHSDDWGQYGSEFLIKYSSFIDGYRLIV